LSAKELERIGGLSFVASLTDGIPNVAQVEKYAQLVAREAKRRRIIAAANDTVQRAIRDDDEPEVIAADALKHFTPTATREDAQARRIGDVIAAAYKTAEARRLSEETLALSTGFSTLDGYQAIRRTLTVVGSPSSHGKSAFAKDLAVGLAKNSHPVAFYTLESTTEEIAWRHVSAESGIPHSRVQDWRRLESNDFQALARVEGAAQRLPIYMTRGVRTIAEIDAETRRLKALSLIDAVIIDYIQLIRFNGGPRDREERMAMIAQTLLELALELQIAVIVTSQVNKERLQRGGGPLYMSDLKYAAAIGESARCGLLFQRPHVENQEERACKVLFQVAKQNEGRTGSYEMHFSETLQRFREDGCVENGCGRSGIEAEAKNQQLKFG
jgi:replicative DNA helicase